MDYVDFHLKIGPRVADNQYSVSARSPSIGESSGVFSQPLTDEQLELFVLKVGLARRSVRRIHSPEWRAAQDFGQKLFRSLFTDEIRAAYLASHNDAVRQGKGLRVKLTLDAPELANYPWEFLYDPSSSQFLSLFEDTPILRYIELTRPVLPLVVTPPLRILAVASSPQDYQQLDLAQERRNLSRALESLEHAGLIEIDWLAAATLEALREQLLKQSYHIFHFIGHGGFDTRQEDGILIFENANHYSNRVSGERLAVILGNHRTLRLAVLNACEGARTSEQDPFAGTAMTLVRTGNLPAVIAMQFEITDSAAIDFASGFYAAIASGRPVDAAVSQGRQAIFTSDNDVEWSTPVLYLRAPDGVIFQVDTSRAAEEARRIAAEQAERAARAEQERLEKVRLEKERVEQERLEKVRLEQERAEQERLEKVRLEKERAEQERLEKVQLENERAEEERLAKIKLELERIDQERLDKVRLDRERAAQAEQERVAQARFEADRVETAQAEQERLDKIGPAQERAAQEQTTLSRQMQEPLAGARVPGFVPPTSQLPERPALPAPKPVPASEQSVAAATPLSGTLRNLAGLSVGTLYLLSGISLALASGVTDAGALALASGSEELPRLQMVGILFAVGALMLGALGAWMLGAAASHRVRLDRKGYLIMIFGWSATFLLGIVAAPLQPDLLLLFVSVGALAGGSTAYALWSNNRDLPRLTLEGIAAGWLFGYIIQGLAVMSAYPSLLESVWDWLLPLQESLGDKPLLVIQIGIIGIFFGAIAPLIGLPVMYWQLWRASAPPSP